MRRRRLAAVLAAVTAVLLVPAAAHAYNLGEMHPKVDGKAKITGDSERDAMLTFVGPNQYQAYFCINEYSGSNPSVKLKYHLDNDTYVTRSWGTGSDTFLCHWAFRGDDPRTRERESDPNPLPTIRSITVYLTAGGETERYNYSNNWDDEEEEEEEEEQEEQEPPTVSPDNTPPREESSPTPQPPSSPSSPLVVLAGPAPARSPAPPTSCISARTKIRVGLAAQQTANMFEGLHAPEISSVEYRTSPKLPRGVTGPPAMSRPVTRSRPPFRANLRNRYHPGTVVEVHARVSYRFMPLSEGEILLPQVSRSRQRIRICGRPSSSSRPDAWVPN